MHFPIPASVVGLALVIACTGMVASPVPQTATGSPAPAAVPTGEPSGRPAAGPTNSPSSTHGPKPARSAKASLATPYYTLDTDVISYKGNGDFTMPNKVAFSRPGSDGTADHAVGNDKRGTVSLIGNVVLHDNGNAPEASAEDEYAKGGPATLTCDQLDVDSKAKIYTAAGHVHFEQGDRKADAERGVLNRTSGMLRLQGSVRTVEGPTSMRADDAEYNLKTKRFEATGRPIRIKQPVPTSEPGSASPTPKPKKRRIPF